MEILLFYYLLVVYPIVLFGNNKNLQFPY